MGILEYWNSTNNVVQPVSVNSSGTLETVSTAGTGVLVSLTRAQDVSGAYQQLDRFHIATHQGYAYAIEHEFTLAGTTAQYMEIVVGAREIHMQDRSVSTNVSDILVELYYAPTVTAGASPVAITPRRFSFSQDDTNLVTARTVESFTGGTLVAGQVIIYGQDGVGNKSSGDGASSSREINFPAEAVIGIKVQRRSGSGAAKVKLDIGYYEIHTGA